MDSEVMFGIIKNMIVEQNKILLERLAHDFKRDKQYLVGKYIQPEFYLPIITKHGVQRR